MEAETPFKARQQKWGQLMKEAQAGDSKAYEELLKELSVVMRTYVLKRLSDKSFVEDLIQEILMGIHKARHTYDSARPFGAWAFAIARYKLTDFIRKRSSIHKFEVAEESIERFSGEKESQDVISDSLDKALQGLAPKDREVVELLKLEGKSVKEVAEKIGSSEGAIKVRAHRAYKELKVKLKDKKL